MEIYFDNLKEETQKELLDNAGISSPEEANWDVFPVAVVETENMLHDKNARGITPLATMKLLF